jgi:hypothetical protein
MPKIDKPFEELMSSLKPIMRDLDPKCPPDLDVYDLVQLKYDGWMTLVVIKDNFATVISSGGAIRHGFPIQSVNIKFLCEWIHGTAWSQLSMFKDKFIIFDFIQRFEDSVENLPYKDRMTIVRNWLGFGANQRDVFMSCISLPSENWEDLWKLRMECTDQQKFEGLVFKRSSDPFSSNMLQARMKRQSSMNYVVMDFKEGNGRLHGSLGALVGGLYVNSELMKICTVGGGFDDSLRDEIWNNRSQYIGEVFEAVGKQLFPSGALRHPAFVQFRKDVSKYECTQSISGYEE